MRIVVYRELERCTEKSTSGSMYINGHFFAYTLEDALRHPAVKIPAETCVPCCTVDVGVSHSRRFGRELPILYNQPNGYEVIINGHSWTGLRAHGANTVADLAGCIGVAEKRLDNDTIQGSRDKDLTTIISEAILGGEEVKLTWVLV